MTLKEAFEIINEENLSGYNFEGEEIRENQVGMIFNGEKCV